MSRRARFTRRLASEQLESRNLLAAAVTLIDNTKVLRIEGTNGKDTIFIENATVVGED